MFIFVGHVHHPFPACRKTKRAAQNHLDGIVSRWCGRERYNLIYFSWTRVLLLCKIWKYKWEKGGMGNFYIQNSTRFICLSISSTNGCWACRSTLTGGPWVYRRAGTGCRTFPLSLIPNPLSLCWKIVHLSQVQIICRSQIQKFFVGFQFVCGLISTDQ